MADYPLLFLYRIDDLKRVDNRESFWTIDIEGEARYTRAWLASGAANASLINGPAQGQSGDECQPFERLRRFTRLSHMFPLERPMTSLGTCRHLGAERNQAPTFVNVWVEGSMGMCG